MKIQITYNFNLIFVLLMKYNKWEVYIYVKKWNSKRKFRVMLVIEQSFSEHHFILECEAYKDGRDKFSDTISESSWHNLFSKEYIEKLGRLIINLHKKRTELLKSA